MSDRAISTIGEFCRHVLESGSLAAKLRRPEGPGGTPLVDEPGAAVFIDAPARDDVLRMHDGADKLPKLGELKDRAARTVVCERFAHHELMAVELFAWALLAYPDAPSALRRGLLTALVEEQRHLELYLGRLEAEGAGLGQTPLSDYFWKVLPTRESDAGDILSFLAGMGLTLEQANLDFTILYRDAFRAAFDEETARVLQVVHDDEIGHVKLAATWFRKLKDPSKSFYDAYTEKVPFPLSAARAKGRRFEIGARRKAGLDDDTIERVRAARPYEGHRRGPRAASET